MLNNWPSTSCRSACKTAFLCMVSLGLFVSGPSQASGVDFDLKPVKQDGMSAPILLNKAVIHYPDSLLGSGKHATVKLQIDIDEIGKVKKITVLSGPVEFQKDSRTAVKNLTFKPASIQGKAVSSKALVEFHFAPFSHAEFNDAMVLVVEESASKNEDVQAVTTVTSKELDRQAGQTLADGVSSAPGVVVAKTTSTAAKPIIRGHQERRLLVLNDGIRHEGQKWGVDHGTEIDSFSAGRINVIRGSAGARYGPDAIGGILLVIPPPMKASLGWGGKWLSAFSTNGLQPYGAFRIDRGHTDGWSFRLLGNYSKSASFETPNYVLGNTASDVGNVSFTAQKTWDAGLLRWRYSRHMFQSGIFYGVRHGTPEEFRNNLEADKPLNSELWTVDYGYERPYQSVAHDTFSQHFHLFGAWGTFNAIYSFQHNLRDEYDKARKSVESPQLKFTLRTHSIDTLYRHPAIDLNWARLNGGIGLQASLQENLYSGVYLLPNYRAYAGGAFAFERLSFPKGDIEFAGRLDGLHRTAYVSENDYERMLRFDSISEEQCDAYSTYFECPSNWLTPSFSIGFLYHAIPDKLDLKIDLSRANRFPSVDESYMVGTAPSFPVYAISDFDLDTETAWNASFTTGLRLPFMNAEISAYAMVVDDYLYFAPELNDSGEATLNVTVQGTKALYRFQSVNAHFYGADGYIELGPKSPFGVDLRGSTVIGLDADSGLSLVGIPADHLTVTVLHRGKTQTNIKSYEMALSVKSVGEARTTSSIDFAPPPEPFNLIGLRTEADLAFGSNQYTLGLQVENALDVAYRDYSSLLRYYADQPGRNIRFYMSQEF